MMLPSKKRVLCVLGLAALGLLAYARLVEPRRLMVRPVSIRLRRLPQAFHGYRIVHLSDIHMGHWMTRARLNQAVALANSLQPDLVALTGDFIDRTAGDVTDDLATPLRQLRARDGVVAVMGNHDYYHGVNGVRRMLRAGGMIDVSNQVHTLRRGEAALHIAGVDDVAERHDCLDAVLDQLPEDGAAVLLAHEPDFADISAATGRFDLQLSGHTHGGQVRLPLIGTPVLPAHGQRYPAGLRCAGDMVVYTNRGLGMIPPYVRLGVRPEIAVITLLRADRLSG